MKIPFTVSARTARLIGRENVATAEGALIELVKNAYDADAEKCIVFFDNHLANQWTDIAKQDFDEILKRVSRPSLFRKSYSFDRTKSRFILVEANRDKLALLREQLMRLGRLWLIDDGVGMDRQTIKNQWMVIGTDAKNLNAYSDGGRVKSGAKGIGRFALDRLGRTCRMITKQAAAAEYNIWNVEWEHFEGQGKLLNNVMAELSFGRNINPAVKLSFPTVIPAPVKAAIQKSAFRRGTIIEITSLSDFWDEKAISKLFSNFESLIPPHEISDFSIFLFTSSAPESYGEVKASTCNDYDYKVVATFGADQRGKVVLYRNEIDIEKLDFDVFKRPGMSEFPYNKAAILNKKYVRRTTLKNLLPGVNETGSYGLGDIGEFDFTFYYMKRDWNLKDAEKFFWRSFDSHSRRTWLDQFGGVKIYRDGFRVRPYGEAGSDAFDWLQLGQRRYESPAAVSRQGAWRVAPQNIAGSINISRIANKAFEDKSSREGLQESNAFSLFKEIILAVIKEFENDRSHIGQELFALNNEKSEREQNRQRAEEVGTKARSKRGKDSPETTDEEVLAKEVEYQKEEIEELKEEQKLLRGLASIGTVISSLTHELYGLRDTMKSRVDDLEGLFSKDMPRSMFADRKDYLNPYILMDEMKRADEKIYRWLQYSLDAVKKDKRQRRSISLSQYFERFNRTWGAVLNDRKATISFDFQPDYDPKIRAFEIDLDSVFNNLLVNSLDAFQRPGASKIRDIDIRVAPSRKNIQIRYADSGPGLSKDIVEPNKIFECFFTTKRDEKTGSPVGTGIGMWLVKSIVDEYNGRITLLRPKAGFAVEILMPGA